MDLRFWADVSTIWLCFLAFIIGLVPAVLLYFCVRGMQIVNRKVPPYLKLGRRYSGIVRDQTHKISAMVAEPLTRTHAEAARYSAIARNLMPDLKSASAQEKELNP